MRRFMIVPMLLVLASAACGDSSTEPEVIDINGTWIGNTAGFTATLDLVEQSGEVSGSGTIAAASETVETEIEGTRDDSDVMFSLIVEGFEPINFEGEIDDANSITGTLNDSGFQDASINLARSPEN